MERKSELELNAQLDKVRVQIRLVLLQQQSQTNQISLQLRIAGLQSALRYH